MVPEDWPAVSAIHEEGVRAGHATFETRLPDWEEWDEAHHEPCRIVAVAGTEVTGWAALSPVSRRRVFCGVGEVSI
jgi:phosphinothricin acetyltransferase